MASNGRMTASFMISRPSTSLPGARILLLPQVHHVLAFILSFLSSRMMLLLIAPPTRSYSLMGYHTHIRPTYPQVSSLASRVHRHRRKGPLAHRSKKSWQATVPWKQRHHQRFLLLAKSTVHHPLDSSRLSLPLRCRVVAFSAQAKCHLPP